MPFFRGHHLRHVVQSVERSGVENAVAVVLCRSPRALARRRLVPTVVPSDEWQSMLLVARELDVPVGGKSDLALADQRPEHAAEDLARQVTPLVLPPLLDFARREWITGSTKDGQYD